MKDKIILAVRIIAISSIVKVLYSNLRSQNETLSFLNIDLKSSFDEYNDRHRDVIKKIHPDKEQGDQ